MSFLINPYAFLAAGGDFEPIATVTVGSGGASSIEFTSIPGTYQHLQVRLIGRTARASNAFDGLFIRLNSDSGSNYAMHYLYGNGAAVYASGSGSTVAGQLHRVPASTAPANIFGGVVADILDYGSTAKNTTVRYLGGVDQNGSGEIFAGSSLWMDTAAVTTVTIQSLNSANFAQYSTAALYGIKA